MSLVRDPVIMDGCSLLSILITLMLDTNNKNDDFNINGNEGCGYKCIHLFINFIAIVIELIVEPHNCYMKSNSIIITQLK